MWIERKHLCKTSCKLKKNKSVCQDDEKEKLKQFA